MVQFITQNSLIKSLQAAVIISIAVYLHACGFQLRGAIDLSDDIAPVFIEPNSYFELAREIKTILNSNKIEIAGKAVNSRSQLTLVNEAKTRRVLSVDGSGRAREYLLIYNVTFNIAAKQAADGELKTKEDSISISRSLLFDPDAVLAVTNETAILYKDMQRESSRLILLKLQAFSGNNSIQKSADEN